MKQILLFFILSSSFGYAQTLQEYAGSFQPDGYVNDFADLLSNQEEDRLNHQLKLIDESTSIQYAVCFINSTFGYAPRDLAAEIGNQWGVGQKGKNNGILLLISKEDKQIFIATGLGTEKYIRDDEVKSIIDSILIPHLKNESYYFGVKSGVEVLQQKLSSTELVQDEEISATAIILTTLTFLLLVAYLAYDYFKLGGFDPKVRMYRTGFQDRNSLSSSGGDSSSFGGGSFGDGELVVLTIEEKNKYRVAPKEF